MSRLARTPRVAGSKPVVVFVLALLLGTGCTGERDSGPGASKGSGPRAASEAPAPSGTPDAATPGAAPADATGADATGADAAGADAAGTDAAGAAAGLRGSGPTAAEAVRAVQWRPAVELNAELPEGVRIFAGVHEGLPLRAWYARIDEPDPSITTRVVVSDDPDDGTETVASFARDLGACVVVNGGYFTLEQTPARHVGLLLVGGELVESATPAVSRGEQRFEVARAAIGFTGDDRVEIAWATSREGIVYRWLRPHSHRPGNPAPDLDYAAAEPWEVRDAVAGGPALVKDGRVQVTVDEEVFFGTSIPEIHPRTAAGRTANGALVLMVVDGRQPLSRGVGLEELAVLMRDIGAREALNLDGGGSVTMVVRGKLVNRPVGGPYQREVMSALATFCDR